jgi:acyl transferase domain-containing protein/thioesterase domain-containing protein
MGGTFEVNPSTAVAVIGLSGRFPGASTPDDLWVNLRAGKESISFFSDDELLRAGESADVLANPAYVRAAGRLDDIAGFDASFFGMSPRDASVCDPQHRLFLECAWEAFEHAGYVGERVPGPVGVFAASGAAEYLMHNLLRNRRIMDSVGAWLVRHTGNDPNFLATRVSYELNLTGPSMSVQTACSSSLAAVHVACQSLLNGECDMALAGGTTVYPHQTRGYLYKEGEILSPDGHCRAFDARSAGTVMASAVGCVVLKRWADAERDGDRVLAIIRGSAINNDGADKVGYLAPSVTGQTRVVSEALAVAAIHPDEVSYVEAHGTGTLIGDPIEITALTQAFRAATARTGFCAIGSIKTNFGHAGEAAGICGLIKTVLALQHRELPPSLHFETPNPQVDFPSTPFRVNTRLCDWTAPPGGTRIAGVTSLGAGGTNVHVLLEEAPPLQPAPTARRQHLLVLSARTPAALDRATANLTAHLRAHPAVPLADTAYTLLAGRKAFACRRAVVAADAREAVAAIEQVNPRRVLSSSDRAAEVATYFMFPGGGAQYPGMGAELYDHEPVYRARFDDALDALEPSHRETVRALVLAPADVAPAVKQRLERPSLALPALFATEYALAQLLWSWGVIPSAMIGHSAGEYTAACLAGVLSLPDAMRLVAERGRLFDGLAVGGMLSVQGAHAHLEGFLPATISCAAINAPTLSVLSGPAADLDAVEQTLRSRDIQCTRLHIDVAAHSAMVDPILADFERVCRTVSFGRPRVPFVSNVTGTWITDEEAADAGYWVRHLRGTVRFADGARTLLEHRDGAFCEVGPGRTLSSLLRQQGRRPPAVTASLRHPDEDESDVASVLAALGRLWVAGVELDEARLFSGERRRRVALPTYPFERQHYWVDPDPTSTTDAPDDGTLVKQADVRDWFSAPSWSRSAPPVSTADSPGKTWLVLTDESRLAEALAGHLRLSGRTVVEVVAGGRFETFGPLRYGVNPASRSDFDELARALRARGALPDSVAHLWALSSRGRGGDIGWRRNWNALETYDEGLAKHYFCLIWLAQAMAGELPALRVFSISSRLQALPGDEDVHAEKATLLGPCKVIPREYPHVRCASIDLAWAGSPEEETRLAGQLLRELAAERPDGEVALRGTDRWVRRFDRVPLEPATERSWLRDRGAYVITGGLGGLGLSVAEHLARHASVKLALIARQALPADAAADGWLAAHGTDDETSRRIAAVRGLRALGAEVLTLAADVADAESMRRALARVRSRFGAVHGVFHAAGILNDELIALRGPSLESPVLDVKVKGALVLDELLAGEPLDLFVLFSSVSSILGLPGQAEYTAANAFLDAFAHARARRGAGRTLAIDWNAWKQVGMLAAHVRQERRTRAGAGTGGGIRRGRHPALDEVVSDTGDAIVVRAALDRDGCWVLGEHVVRGGQAPFPGTGYLEFVRAAHARGGETRPIEFRDVLFLRPLVVATDETATLQIRVDRGAPGRFACHSADPSAPHAVGTIGYVDPAPAGRTDLTAIRARCGTEVETRQGHLVQHFMDLGPRWGSVERLALGHDEAVLDLALDARFARDLEMYALHPALLDLATGGAQVLAPEFDARETFYVPFSYGRVLVRGPLPSRVVSHIRLRHVTRESITFDATVYDERGDERVVVSNFVMRRATAAFGTSLTAARPADRARRATGHDTAAEAALRVGMSPPEGLDALDRILAVEFSPQVVACTVPLDGWLARLRDEAAAMAAETQGSAASGPVFARPSVSATFVAPGDAIERDLAAMWCGLLGLSQVGIHDDFFELGGQSLVAVRLFQRIGRQYGVELPLPTLFEAPTIAGCAAVIRGQLGAAAGGRAADPVAAVQPAASGPALRRPAFRALVVVQEGQGRTPFFCMHGAGGNVLNFRDLARAMHPTQPVYGLQAAGVDGLSRPRETVEEMARAYLEEIQVLQPHGPYLLGGYSGGGIVAFEMARRLTAMGEAVALLALLDTFHPHMPLPHINVFTRLERLRREGISYVRGALERVRQSAQEARDERAIEEHLASGQPIPHALRETHVMHAFERAARAYQPAPWPGKATLFRATEVDYFFQAGGPAYGWERDIVGGIEIVTVPGDHNTLMVGGNAARLARALGAAIDRALAPADGAASRGGDQEAAAR